MEMGDSSSTSDEAPQAALLPTDCKHLQSVCVVNGIEGRASSQNCPAGQDGLDWSTAVMRLKGLCIVIANIFFEHTIGPSGEW